MKMNINRAFLVVATFLLSACFFEIEKPLPSCDLSVATINVTEKNTSFDKVAAEILALNADVVMLSDIGEGWKQLENAVSIQYKTHFLTEPFEGKTFRLAFLTKTEIKVAKVAERNENYLSGMPGSVAKLGILSLTVKGESVVLLTMNPVQYRRFVTLYSGTISDGLFYFKSPEAQIENEKVIWGGSFEFTPLMKIYGRFEKSGLVDSFTADKNPYNVTENNSSRTDYLFSSKQIKCVFSGTFKVTGSNHRGVVAGYNF